MARTGNRKPLNVNGDSRLVSGFEYMLRLPMKNWGILPEISAVYFLHTEYGFIYYIGETKNLRKRIRYHQTSKSWEWRKRRQAGIRRLHVAWFPVMPEHRKSVEADFIAMVRPPLNGIHKGTLRESVQRSCSPYMCVAFARQYKEQRQTV